MVIKRSRQSLVSIRQRKRLKKPTSVRLMDSWIVVDDAGDISEDDEREANTYGDDRQEAHSDREDGSQVNSGKLREPCPSDDAMGRDDEIGLPGCNELHESVVKGLSDFLNWVIDRFKERLIDEDTESIFVYFRTHALAILEDPVSLSIPWNKFDGSALFQFEAYFVRAFDYIKAKAYFKEAVNGIISAIQRNYKDLKEKHSREVQSVHWEFLRKVLSFYARNVEALILKPSGLRSLNVALDSATEGRVVEVKAIMRGNPLCSEEITDSLPPKLQSIIHDFVTTFVVLCEDSCTMAFYCNEGVEFCIRLMSMKMRYPRLCCDVDQLICKALKEIFPRAFKTSMKNKEKESCRQIACVFSACVASLSPQDKSSYLEMIPEDIASYSCIHEHLWTAITALVLHSDDAAQALSIYDRVSPLLTEAFELKKWHFVVAMAVVCLRVPEREEQFMKWLLKALNLRSCAFKLHSQHPRLYYVACLAPYEEGTSPMPTYEGMKLLATLSRFKDASKIVSDLLDFCPADIEKLTSSEHWPCFQRDISKLMVSGMPDPEEVMAQVPLEETSVSMSTKRKDSWEKVLLCKRKAMAIAEERKLRKMVPSKCKRFTWTERIMKLREMQKKQLVRVRELKKKEKQGDESSKDTT